MSVLRTLLREPLVQFLLIGAVIAGLWSLAQQGGAAPRSDGIETIVLSEGRVEQLRQLFERTWQRPPTDDELSGMIDAFVREEVLYRAGRDLGLEQDDPVIRRRVAQKMEFLLEAAPGDLSPTDEALAEHLATHAARFELPARVAFQHVFIDPAKRAESVDDEVAAIGRELAQGTDPSTLGDTTLLPREVGLVPIARIERLFGPAFAQALLALPRGGWEGPLTSHYGLHLVRVDERQPARSPALHEVRESVLRHWETLRREELAQARFAELKARYEIVVEQAEAARAPQEEAARGDVGRALR